MSELNIEGVSPLSLQDFEMEGYSDEDALTLAQGLLASAVPCLSTLYPLMTAGDKLLAKYAVLEMAKYIKIDYFNFERSTSPFQGETIGSYSYNKISSSVGRGEATRVPRFDDAVSRFVGLCEDAGSGVGTTSASSEQVFKPGFDNYMASKKSTTLTSVWGWWV